MDSRLVNAELRLQVRPDLKDAGFTRFTDRNAWRYTNGRIDVVNFQSFNSYLAEGIGSTTYSFAVNLGCAFEHIPRQRPFKLRGGLPAPPEWECDLRRALQKSIDQPELSRTTVWYIDERGVYRMPAIVDAKHAILDEGLPWFDRFSDPGELLRTLLEDEDDMEGTWGFGNDPSPKRSLLTAYTALHLGLHDLAREHLARLASGESSLATDRVRAELAALEDTAGAS